MSTTSLAAMPFDLPWSHPSDRDSQEHPLDRLRPEQEERHRAGHMYDNQNRQGESAIDNQRPPDPTAIEQPDQEDTMETFRLHSEITLGDGRSVTGEIRFQSPDPLYIRHSHEGILYERNLRINDIQMIRINTWKPNPTRENEEGQIYEFIPDEYTIVLKSGTRLHPTGSLPPFWRELVIENDHGNVRFFGYWIDLLKENGTWYTGMEGPPDRPRAFCHPEVIRSIEFQN